MTPPSPHSSRIRTSIPDVLTAIDRSHPDFPAAQSIDENNYFATHAPPPYLSEVSKQIADFINFHHQQRERKRIVLVTSGGTTVPLENNTVRFIDNFSAGTRGATSAEYFLEKGYAVIFLHREFSLLPYSRHYSHTTNCFLDYMKEEDGKVAIEDDYQREMIKVLRKYRLARDSNLLLLLPFTTVQQYLFTLKLVAQQLSVIGSNALFYLAAAVSDFFLPSSKLPEHKIQSQESGGKLVMNLEPVPKFLSRLVDSWAPIAMIVSFKLETDETILIKKCRDALERYCHQLVIGNLLQSRKQEVVFVTKNEETWIKLDDPLNQNIENLIIPEVISRHTQWIEDRKSKGIC